MRRAWGLGIVRSNGKWYYLCARGDKALHKTERKQTMKKILMMIVAAAAMLLAGCGEKKCFFTTQDGKFLKKGTTVTWSKTNAPVGEIEELEETENGTRATIRFAKKYTDFFHDGVTGRVVLKKDAAHPSAEIVLFSGGNEKNPLLQNGDVIPESKDEGVLKDNWSAFTDWLTTSRVEEIKVVGSILGILLLLLKFGSRMLKFAAFLGIVGAIVYVCVTANIDWKRHKERLVNAKETVQEVKAWLLQHGDKVTSVLETAEEVTN